MANSKQAEKRNRQREKRRIRNRVSLGAMRTAIKRARDAVDESSPEAPTLIAVAVRRIDRAVAKSVLKQQTGSRLVSRLVTRSAATE
jgi:small subunit ribosomal protein S20